MTTAVTHRYLASPRRGVRPRLDLYLPARPRAAVMLLHGGAFVVGTRNGPAMRRCAQALVGHGLAAFAVDYRLLGRGGRFDASLDDALAALAWFRGHASDWGIPCDNLGIMGLSAGGALAAVAASEGGAAAWVGVYGPYDFTRLPGRPPLDGPTRWLLRTSDLEALRSLSPVHRATAPVATLLIHGRRDRLVPMAHAEALAAARRARNLPVEILRLEAGHGFMRSDSGATREALSASAAFFVTHLR